ncbi:hypothetical protein [Pelagicoccus sp. SDUM812002]|uniref:hypothetical protein n=1 Tax=Pelagicoccus sp. SDUM812002 TaxID=3041266 RepID=UPI00280F202C|nr:hypothetical protein [Pelagicoccus sp. SDUM812002]MDQ8185806.1 hypothetical protein [Pelagicoccus sp. SDUM812002]
MLFKKLFFCAWVLGGSATSVVSSDLEKFKIPIDDLKSPAVPAQVMFESAPTLLPEATSLKEYQVNVQAALDDASAGGYNFAFQITPSLLSREGTGYSLDEYYGNRSISGNIKRSFSASFAVQDFKRKIEDMSFSGRAYAVGLKTDLLKKSPDLEEIVTLRDSLVEEGDEFLNKMANKVAAGEMDIPETGEKIDSILDYRPSSEAMKSIRRLLDKKSGFGFEFAAALRYDDYSETEIDDDVTKYSAWAKLEYTPSGAANDFTFLFLGRENFSQIDEIDDSTDYGLRILWKFDKKIDLSLEYLEREGSGFRDERLAVLIDYEFDENYSLVLSYGDVLDDSGQPDGERLLTVSFNSPFGKIPFLK